jgi:hypothetical protein
MEQQWFRELKLSCKAIVNWISDTSTAQPLNKAKTLDQAKPQFPEILCINLC